MRGGGLANEDMSIGRSPGDMGSPSYEAICFFRADLVFLSVVYGILPGTANLVQANLGITVYFLS